MGVSGARFRYEQIREGGRCQRGDRDLSLRLKHKAQKVASHFIGRPVFFFQQAAERLAYCSLVQIDTRMDSTVPLPC